VAAESPEDALRLLERFHGHLGPFVVLGYRMGAAARRELDVGPFDLRAEVMTGTTPPVSCLVDGIQMGACCTLGKGSISVRAEGLAEAVFTTKDGRVLRASVRPEALAHIPKDAPRAEIVALAHEMMAAPEDRILALVHVGIDA
jgi:formylmethanofuran dehydrogenase subunit E